MSKHLILGSASPRRRELLSLITEDFTIKLADIDERALETDLETRNVPAIEVSEELASAKAHAVFEMLDQDSRASSVVAKRIPTNNVVNAGIFWSITLVRKRERNFQFGSLITRFLLLLLSSPLMNCRGVCEREVHIISRFMRNIIISGTTVVLTNALAFHIVL